jgi:nucleotide-binding universal stress UspA family protein
MEAVYRNLLLPVDGSQQSIDAFKRGITQAKVWGSSVYLVQVLSEENVGFNIQERESFLNALEKYANDRGIYLHKELIFGDPRTQIAEELIDEWDIDLIIIGATGKGRVAKILVGSVTTYVVRNAKCDVIISR